MAALAALSATGAQAVAVASVSPQGEVAQVRQVVLRFDADVVPLGEPRLADPATVACEGGTPAGAGRWSDARTWLHDFRAPLPAGKRCSLTFKPDWQPTGGPLTGPTRFAFSTGGPAVARLLPYEGGQIDEQQHFLLQLTGPVQEASLAGRAGCEVEGLGDRLPVRVVTGPVRDELLKAQRLEKQADRWLVLACQRPLPNGAAVRLVWGAGIAAAADPAVATRAPQVFRYTVRPAFTAEFSCERERANAPCLPIRPLGLNFSEPVPRALAQQVRLQPASGAALAPVFDRDDTATEVQRLQFPRPLAENARYTIVLPAGLKDNAGRALANAASFPLAVATGDAPPIAKFAAAPFGILERGADAVLPVTLRHVQGDLRPAAPGGQVRLKRLDSAADIVAWLGRVQRFHESVIGAQAAGLPERDWTELQTYTDAQGRPRQRQVPRSVATRELSLLKADAGATRLDLPALQGGDPRPFEVVGIPLPGPGYHVVEIESRRLGESLLDKAAPMYVRTGVLVTNLGLHFKHGRENSLAWVTTLDRARPVAGAQVAVHDCNGRMLWQGATDTSGRARIDQVLDPGMLSCAGERGLFVTARQVDAQGVADHAFVFSTWQKGIEPWRFNQPTDHRPGPELRVHTVLDRTLLRAGETVSMKHIVRTETSKGLSPTPREGLPSTATVVHQGSGQRFELALAWQGSRSATSQWAIPRTARLGSYQVVLSRVGGGARQRQQWDGGEFRVEEFRLPLVDARIVAPKAAPLAPRELALDVRMNFLSGGAMAQAPLQGSALLKPRTPQFAGHEGFSFEPPRADGPEGAAPDDDADTPAVPAGRLVADKLALTTDAAGAARLVLKDLPPITRPSEITAEISYQDPNGEVQTVASTVPVWPAAVVLGVRTAGWASARGEVAFSVLALDTAGRPLVKQAVAVHGRLAQSISSRKRLVGGFYAYDHRTEMKDLGPLCSGSTDERGLLACTATLAQAGQVELVARATDAAGRAAQAAASVWVTRQGELWFEQDNDDRIDVLPEKRRYEPGETARLQVRMPFRQATALVAVEREGVIDTRVVALRGDDPTIELKIDPAWGPNVYVSVLAVRGRLREVPWYSFFQWGWREPLDWLRSFRDAGQPPPVPTAMVDLGKPAFKLGVAALQVGLAAHQLDVVVTPAQPQYAIRQTAQVKLRVTQGGQPVAGTEVAFAAVDEGLLALRSNDSWNLLPAMLRERAWGVTTATAQSEIIGRRHHGRKAVAAGGGGGRGGTRELFDTLLLWQPRVVLDANGEATLTVPLNDSLTSFRLVAVADDGGQRFGTGSASIRVTQDLQVLAGLPPLVREGDRYTALLTLRNTTARAMTLRATLQGAVSGTPAGAASSPALATASGAAGRRSEAVAVRPAALALPTQTVTLAAGASQEITWPVVVPEGATGITWEAAVEETGGPGAKDRLKFNQVVKPAVPLRVLQATLQQLDGPLAWPVAPPADALPAGGPPRGGLLVAVQPSLGGALPGLRRFFEDYPFTCLEQKASRAIGLKDAAQWQAMAEALPSYLDADGLASYFPPRAGDPPAGSDRLTAYLLAAAHEAGYALPPAARDAMLDGLAAFVLGRIERKTWSPRPDGDVRRLAAIEALARHGRAQPKMLGTVQLVPAQWPTAALIDWLSILKRLDGVPARARRTAEAQQALRARLTWAGTTLKFSNEADDFWWWLMDSPDGNAARLILLVLDDPAWRAELPRLVVGALGRQRQGAWLTTTANLWGTLALDKFAAAFETVKPSGRTQASLAGSGGAGAVQAIDWAQSPQGGRLMLPWPAGPGSLNVAQQGSGRPWLTVQSLAAIPLAAPLRAGYGITRSVTAVQRRSPDAWSRGDVLRVRLEVQAQSDLGWVVVSDPVPAGATILGSGLGRDSAIASRGEQRSGDAEPAFEERGFEAFRSYFAHLSAGRHVLEYTLRLNNPGRFVLPPSRVEAMYAPESFGETPNAALEVAP